MRAIIDLVTVDRAGNAPDADKTAGTVVAIAAAWYEY